MYSTSPHFLRRLLVVFFLIASAVVIAQPMTVRVTREVTFEVDLRDEIAAGRFDPARDRVGLRGAGKPLAWDRSLEAKPVVAANETGAAVQASGLYRAVVRFERPAEGGQLLQYKWKIERPGAGANEGWEDGRNRALAIDVAQQTASRKFNAPPEPIPLQRTGRIERFAVIASDAKSSSTSAAPSSDLTSKHVSPRGVQVWLPPSYEREPQRRFPVLYMHDGQAVFDAAMVGAEWQMDEAAQRMIERGEIAPFIIVAVDNTERRFDEYTPTRARLPSERVAPGRDAAMGGGAPAYAKFLVEELKPEIDRRFRTLPAREHTSVGGASLGGLLSLWLTLHHADTFGAALVVSPSVWWDDRFVLRDVARAVIPADKRAKLWLDIGANETPVAVPNTRALRDALVERGWRDANLRYNEDADGSHDEASWALRVPAMLRFLYAVR
jgi:predicted alpha/beta superfamily hydrolase